MKNYEEMAKCVFEARDIHIRKRDRQKAMIKRYATVVSELCFSLMIGLIVLNHRGQPPAIPDDIGFTGTTATSYTEKINIISVPPLQTTSYFTAQSKAHEEINTKSEMISVSLNASVTPSLHSDAEAVTQIKGEQYRTDAHQIITKADITEPVKAESVTDIPADTSEPVITVIATKSPEPPPIPSPDISSDAFDQATKPINQQYNLAQIKTSAACYMTANIELSSEKIDKRIGIACMSGYDIQKDTYYSCNAEVFSIALAAQTEAVAIKFESSEKYYLYLLDSLDSNSTATIISSLK